MCDSVITDEMKRWPQHSSLPALLQVPVVWATKMVPLCGWHSKCPAERHRRAQESRTIAQDKSFDGIGCDSRVRP